MLGMRNVAIAGNSDYAEFDGTNLSNQGGSGALCGTKTGGFKSNHQNDQGDDNDQGKGKGKGAAFTYHVSVSNFSAETAVLRLTHLDGVDFERYQIPAGTSYSLTHEGGTNPTNKAVRFSIESNGQLAGQASVTGSQVFCLSCDADADGAPACDAIIPVGGTGAGPNN